MDTAEYKTGHLLVQLGNAVTWFRNQKMHAVGLTSSQSGAIGHIQKYGKEGMMAGDLMIQMNLSKPTVSGIVKLLEKKGLIIRRADKSDERRRIIVLTEKGRKLEGSLEHVAIQTEETLLRGMTEKERAEFNRLLKIALNNMNSYRLTKFF